ncbi:MAG: hypothetical protein EXS13_06520 [Planctomycetes bacterium]|nr:hypothetical protein [Planctomycetota bacterium]
MLADADPTEEEYRFSAVPGDYQVRWATTGKGSSDLHKVSIKQPGEVIELLLTVKENNEGDSSEE